MEQEAANLKTNIAMAMDKDGKKVAIAEFTRMSRVKYTEGTWSNWMEGTRTFFLGDTELMLSEQQDTFASKLGETFTLVEWGVRKLPDPT